MQAQTPEIHLPNGLLHLKPHLPMEGIPKICGLRQTLLPLKFSWIRESSTPISVFVGPPQAQPPQIHLLNWLLHPKIHLPMDGALKIQVGTSSHRCVQRVYGGEVSAP